MCKETIRPTTEDGLFLLFHHIPCESHVYIHFVSIHSDGSVALYCLIWVRFWVTFHRRAHNRLPGLWPSVLTALVHLSQLRRRLQRSLFQLLTHIFFSVCGQGFSRATPLCCYCCPRDILQEFLERVSGFFTSLNFATFCLTFRLFKQSFFLRVGISQGICLTLVYAERTELGTEKLLHLVEAGTNYIK